MFTDRAERFVAGELVREQLFLQLGAGESTIEEIIKTIGRFMAVHDVKAFRNNFRARCNWAFEVPSARPVRRAISL